MESLTWQIQLELHPVEIHQEMVLFVRANTVNKLSIHVWGLVM